MKKLTKKSLNELAIMMPILSEIQQRSFIGGGDGSIYSPYTTDEYYQIFGNGSWQGGYVEGFGLVGPDGINSGGTSGSEPSGSNPDYNVSFSGQTADSSTISNYTMTLLYTIMQEANDNSITITSTTRSPYDQARIMYDNINSSGIQSQLDIYGTVGDSVINIYDPNLSREQNIVSPR